MEVIPFPLDPKNFFYCEKQRQTQRKKLNLLDDDIVFIYTGRLSQQKRISELIKSFNCLPTEKRKKSTLLLAGHFDDLSNPYLGEHKTRFLYESEIQEQIKIGKTKKSRIHYLGNIPTTELKSLYSCADYFVSLSTHHDEDFGMSPIESLFCGTKCILSDWGGYASFAINDKFCKLIPVRYKKIKCLFSLMKSKKNLPKQLTITLIIQKKMFLNFIKNTFQFYLALNASLKPSTLNLINLKILRKYFSK